MHIFLGALRVKSSTYSTKGHTDRPRETTGPLFLEGPGPYKNYLQTLVTFQRGPELLSPPLDPPMNVPKPGFLMITLICLRQQIV